MSTRSSPSDKSELDKLLEEAEDFGYDYDNTPSSIYDEGSRNLNAENNDIRTESMNIFGDTEKKFYSERPRGYNEFSSKEKNEVSPSIVASKSENNESKINKQNDELLKLQQMLQEANTKISLLNGELSNLKANYANVCKNLNAMNKSLEPMRNQFIKLQEDNKKLVEENQRLERTSTGLTRKIDYYESELNKKDNEINKYKNILNATNLESNNSESNPSDKPSSNPINEHSNEHSKSSENNNSSDNNINNKNVEDDYNNYNSNIDDVASNNNNNNYSKNNIDPKDLEERNSFDESDLDYQTKLDKPVKDFKDLYEPIRFDFDDRVFDMIKKGEYCLSRKQGLKSFKNSKGFNKVKSVGNILKSFGSGFLKGHYKKNMKTMAKTGAIVGLSAILGPFAIAGSTALCTSAAIIKSYKHSDAVIDIVQRECRKMLRFLKDLNERGYHLKTNFNEVNKFTDYLKYIVKDYSDRFFPEEIEDIKTFLRLINVYQNVNLASL